MASTLLASSPILSSGTRYALLKRPTTLPQSQCRTAPAHRCPKQRGLSTDAQEAFQRVMNRHDRMTGGGGVHRSRQAKVGMYMDRPVMTMRRLGILLSERFGVIAEEPEAEAVA